MTSKHQRILRNFLITCVGIGIATAGFGWTVMRNTSRGNLSSRFACGWFLIGRDYAHDKTMQAGNKQYYLEIADTEYERTKGLGGEKCLPNNAGKLFIFPEAAKYCFWMKDMRFDLDILWVAQDGTVVEIQKNISKTSYPTSFCNTTPAKYVIELPAGATERSDIRIGQRLPIK